MATSSDFVWRTLLQNQLQHLENVSDDFRLGLERLALPLDRCPSISELNDRLAELSETPFKLVQVSGLIPAGEFFAMLRKRQFPVVQKLREHAGHLETYDPDFWHDTFGHLPYLTLDKYCQLYELFGQLGSKEEVFEKVASLYWFSVEFGLVKTPESESKLVKSWQILGAGILPSPEEITYCLSEATTKSHFDPQVVESVPFKAGCLQNRLFWIHSVEELTKQLIAWGRHSQLL